MRELKSRVWSEGDREYRTDCDVFRLFHSKTGCPATIYSDEGDRFDIEQYTGLKDRGKEIYEGDIIRWANSVGREITAPVVWNTRAWCWTAGDYMLGGLLEFDLEVVGNIHEDLKLLEAKQ